MRHLFSNGVVAAMLVLPFFTTAEEVCLFDETPDFAEKLFRSFDGGSASVETGPALNGQLLLRVTPSARGCEFFYDRAFVWEYGIDEKPVAGEFRYVLFAWKKEGGSTVQIAFRDDRSDLVMTYYAGQQLEVPVRANMKYVSVADEVPDQWTCVIRDLYADMQGCQPNFLMNGIYFIPGDGVSADFDCIYLSNSRETLEQLAATFLKETK